MVWRNIFLSHYKVMELKQESSLVHVKWLFSTLCKTILWQSPGTMYMS